MRKLFLKLFSLQTANGRYYNSIPEDDLISRQRYRLFRTTSIVGGIIIGLAFLQAVYVVNVDNLASRMIGVLDVLFIANFFILPYHKNHRLSYYSMVLIPFVTLHILSYFSGGIRASAVMYMVIDMLLAFMLLGNKAGKWIFALIAVNLIYFFYLSENTSLITYDLIGADSHMINMDYVTTFLFSMLVLSAQMNYLESGKNIVIQRITEQRNELRIKNQELRKLSIVASKADNAIVISNSKGIAEWVNDGFIRLTGYSAAEVEGKMPSEMLHGKGTDQHVLQQLKDAIRDRQSFSGELLKYKKDGTRFWTQVTMTPIIADDKGTEKFITIESDITPRKIVEEKMKVYMLNLEKTNRELDKFAYVVSHDLKAPLRAIGNLTGWIEEDMGDRIPEEMRTHFNTIKGRVVRMEGLINGILDYTKAAKTGGILESFNSDVLVRETIDLVGPPKNAIINVREGMPEMKSEPVKLQQIFLNLIHNAVKYNDKEDIQVEIGCEDKGADWQFYVKDNGPGIETRYHEKIFVIFQTLNARDEVESRGVGLAIVKKIIEEDGGKIWLESEKGKGATFYFSWPKQKKKPVEEELLFDPAEIS